MCEQREASTIVVVVARLSSSGPPDLGTLHMIFIAISPCLDRRRGVDQCRQVRADWTADRGRESYLEYIADACVSSSGQATKWGSSHKSLLLVVENDRLDRHRVKYALLRTSASTAAIHQPQCPATQLLMLLPKRLQNTIQVRIMHTNCIKL